MREVGELLMKVGTYVGIALLLLNFGLVVRAGRDIIFPFEHPLIQVIVFGNVAMIFLGVVLHLLPMKQRA